MRTPLLALLLVSGLALALHWNTPPRPEVAAAARAERQVAPETAAFEPPRAVAVRDSVRIDTSTATSDTAAARGDAPPAELLERVDEALLPAALPRDFDRSVYRQRFARIDPDRFLEGTRLEWNLFDDVAHSVVLEDARYKSFDGAKLSWHGHVAGDPGSQVLVLVNRGAVTANISLSDGRLYSIDTVTPGVQRIQEINVAALPPCASETDPAAAEALGDAGETAEPPPPQAAANGGPEVIDVLQLYTPGARDYFGSAQALEDRLELLIDWSNVVYANSSATQRLRSAGILEVSYDDSHGDGNTALDDLTFSGDGELEDVPGLRDQYGADMVSLFTAPNGICGIAWVASAASFIAWYDDYMFSVVNVSCIGNPRTFTHELAHNQGAYHDPETSLSQGMTQAEINAVPYPNSFGYIAPGDAFRTIMAYGSTCGWCPALEQFSNPNLSHLGLATGDTRSNVHQTLEATYATIAGFRSAAACTAQGDSDADSVCDALDNCVQIANADQFDGDEDGFGDACDADYDNNGAVGLSDFALLTPLIGTVSGNPGYDATRDHSGDGAIGMPDFGYLVGEIGNAPGPSALACAGTIPCSNP